MKATFKSASQEEFDAKRPALIKAIGGTRWKTSIRDARSSRPNEAKPPVYQAQKEILSKIDKNFLQMLNSIKDEVNEIIEE